MSRRRRRPPASALTGVVVGFAAGSVPFSNLAARRTRGVDLREVGTGTVSGTSLYRVAGFGPLALAGVLDVGKGAVGPLIARRAGPTAAALAGGAAVAGHNWSPFLRGAGGRGISPAIGALLAQAWPGAVVLLAGLTGGRVVRQTAVGSLVADALLVPVLRWRYGPVGTGVGVAVLVPMLAKRLAGNEPIRHDPARTLLHRLLFDRDPE